MFFRFRAVFFAGLFLAAPLATAAPIPRASPYVTEITRAIAGARFRMGDEVHDLFMKRIPSLVGVRELEEPK